MVLLWHRCEAPLFLRVYLKELSSLNTFFSRFVVKVNQFDLFANNNI